jgi:alpha-N-arabinofuranosidase
MTFRVAPSAFTTTLMLVSMTSLAQTAKLTVEAANIVSPVSPTLYGLMTEEINHSYDGGLYAEMVSNRSFRAIWSGLENWTLIQNGNARASMGVDKTNGPSAALPTSMKLTVDAVPTGRAGISNPGWWGMAVRPRTTYHGSFYAKADVDLGPLTAALVSDDTGVTLAHAAVALHSGPWSQYTYTLTTGATVTPSAHNHLELTVARPGTLWLQLASLVPPTYANRANGNRADLMEKMAAMRPNFIRLPGGNYLEGDTLKDWYNFKETIGPLVDRPGHQAPWSYWSTDGFGLLEFLEWTEDLHVEPVLAVYAGYSLKGQKVTSEKDLQPYIQAALDEVEYVTGDVSTKWGAQRAKDGHAAPFPLHYIEIGNEDWLDRSGSYEQRYPPFALALRKKYPQYKLIATAPLKKSTPGADPDVIDDHYYKSPADMFAMVHHYDDAPRNGPKIFVGEWATRSGSPTPNFADALGDAALMTSMERNSDLIVMAAYAPLLVNVNPGAMQWSTDLIGFDAMTSYGSPSWHAQCLFAAHLGDGTAKSSLDGAGERFFYSATVSSKTKMLHLKLVNASDVAQPLTLDLQGTKAGPAKVISLHAASYQATNSITAPDFIKPVESTVRLTSAHTVPAFTIEVIDIPLK